MGVKQQISKMSGKHLLLGLSIVCFLLLSMLMVFSGDGKSQDYEPSQLKVLENAKVEVMPINIQNQYKRERIVFGQVESGMQSDVGFELAGVISELLVEEGESVVKGQALAKLDLARLEAQANELEAALKRAQAESRLAELSSKRVADLVKAKLEPQQRLDEAQANLDASQALENEVLARLSSLTVEKQKSVLLAPFDAQVIEQYTDEGTVVSNGQPVFSLLSLDTLEARFGLPEDIAFGLELGQSFQLSLGQSSFEAKVKSVAKQRNLSTRTIDALFTIEQSALSEQQLRALVSGDLVNIRVEIEIDKKGAWVPLSALSSGLRGLWTVFVYDESTQRIDSRLVSVEQLSAERAFVSGAIKQGDLLVSHGAHRFTPGQKVSQISRLSADGAFALTLLKDLDTGPEYDPVQRSHKGKD